MKDFLKVVLVFLGLLIGSVTFLILSMKNLFFIIPFLGCAMGAWYIAKLFIFIFQNHEHLSKMFNIVLNIIYSFSKSGIRSNDPRLEEFIERYSVDPKVFEKNYR